MDLAGILDLPALREDLGRVEASLKQSVESDDPFLTDVATHLIGAGGKRLRPTLLLCSSYAAGGAPRSAPEEVVNAAVAVELVHMGSLYHDDVIDEAVIRRGIESVNAKWNNIVAILAGDFLLARASELASALGGEIARILAATIGRLCQGQVLECQHAFDIERDEASYYRAIEGKTAALMSTASRVGAMVSRLARPQVETLAEFGHHLGVVFQIIDDLLDITATEEQLGKPTGQDVTDGIYTLPVILALGADGTGDRLRALLGGPVDAETLAGARGLIVGSGAVERTREVARRRAEAAVAVLDGLDGLAPDVTAALARLTWALLDRTS